MANVGDSNFIRYIYRGEEGEVIPRNATHVEVDKDVTVVLADAFRELYDGNIVEVICHANVEKIEKHAFLLSPSLRRLIMLGVTVVEYGAFCDCPVLTDVECDKLEIIEGGAFHGCESLGSINLPSARIIEDSAFMYCYALKEVKFGNKLERIHEGAFSSAILWNESKSH